MSDPSDDSGDAPTDGIRLLEAALSTVFEEGTVVGAFLCLSIAVLYVIWRAVQWLLTLQRSRTEARMQEAQAKRLQEMAAAMERARAEERARYAANPFRFHVPGSVTFDDVMRGSGGQSAGAAGGGGASSSGSADGGAPGPLEGRRSIVSMRSPMVSAYAAAAAVGASSSAGSATTTSPATLDPGADPHAAAADAMSSALASSGVSVRRLGSGSKSNRRLSAMARDAEQPSSGHIRELRKSAVVPIAALPAASQGTGSS